MACGGLVLTGAASALSACARQVPGRDEPAIDGHEGDERETAEAPAPAYRGPTEDRDWIPPISHVARLPMDQGRMRIDGVGSVGFDSSQVETVRPDIFRPGHFLLFDILVHPLG